MLLPPYGELEAASPAGVILRVSFLTVESVGRA